MTAKRLSGYSIFEQGAGVFDLNQFHQYMIKNLLKLDNQK